MNKKVFCILEQSGEKNNPLTEEKKELFTTEFSDFYRLNWKVEDDPLADFTEKNILWSEGRSILWERVPKIYDFYLFTDDDIVFHNMVGDKKEIPIRIKDLLNRYKPISATFFDPNQWAFHPDFIKIDETILEREVFPIAGFDLQTHIFSKSFAEKMFPVLYHGADRCMWYSHWICNKLYPLKQICITSIQVSNTVENNHFDNATPLEAEIMVWKFFKDTKGKDRIKSFRYFSTKTKEIIDKEVNKKDINLTDSDLNRILKPNSLIFGNRKTRLEKDKEINFTDKILYFLNITNLLSFALKKMKASVVGIYKNM